MTGREEARQVGRQSMQGGRAGMAGMVRQANPASHAKRQNKPGAKQAGMPSQASQQAKQGADQQGTPDMAGRQSRQGRSGSPGQAGRGHAPSGTNPMILCWLLTQAA